MAFSSPSKLLPPMVFAPCSIPYRVITKEEFYAFHHGERTLFARLVMELERNQDLSLQVMSLWIWLQRFSCSPVIPTILKFPNPKLQLLYDEALVCLKLVRYETRVSKAKEVLIPLIKSVARNLDLSPIFFVENQVEILAALVKVFEDVCVYAFNDIIEMSFMKYVHVANVEETVVSRGVTPSTMVYDVSYIAQANAPMPVGPIYTDSTIAHGTRGFVNYMPQPLQDVTEMLRLMKLRNPNGEEQVLPDERTVFLTFSKGYPIPAQEIRNYFTRLYGDIVEGIHMQYVPIGDQPLFARMVLRSRSAALKILKGRDRVRFSIKGKHLWVREFVHRSLRPSKAVPTTTESTADAIDKKSEDIKQPSSKFLKFFNQ